MIFVIDEQMPRSLARLLRDLGHEAHHTLDLGLNASSDLQVFEAAIALGAAIITKDSDFIGLRQSSSDPPIIWWRRGNASTREVLAECGAMLPDLLRRLSSGEGVLEVS